MPNRHAENGRKAVMQHTDAAADPHESLQTYVGDLLADLMHLCDADGLSFEAALRSARLHHDAEPKNR